MSLHTISTTIREFLFPPPETCCFCGGEHRSAGFCTNCWQEICDLKKQEFCHECGRIINKRKGCPECSDTTYAFSMARGVGEFRGIIREMLYQFKYVGKQSLAQPMGNLMAEVILNQSGFSGAHCLVPIPLAKGRLESRRFNQSQLLAEEIGRLVELTVANRLLFRARETVVQAKLGRTDRIHNMEGAFLVDPQGQPYLNNKKIIVVDDVFTTGSTANAAATALLGAGAAEVTVITWATGIAGSLADNVRHNEEEHHERHEHQKLREMRQDL